jgi:hypothetical protein
MQQSSEDEPTFFDIARKAFKPHKKTVLTPEEILLSFPFGGKITSTCDFFDFLNPKAVKNHCRGILIPETIFINNGKALTFIQGEVSSWYHNEKKGLDIVLKVKDAPWDLKLQKIMAKFGMVYEPTSYEMSMSTKKRKYTVYFFVLKLII